MQPLDVTTSTDPYGLLVVITTLLGGFGWLGKSYIDSLKSERDKYRDIVLDMLPKQKKTVEDRDYTIEELQKEVLRLSKKFETKAVQ